MTPKLLLTALLSLVLVACGASYGPMAASTEGATYAEDYAYASADIDGARLQTESVALASDSRARGRSAPAPQAQPQQRSPRADSAPGPSPAARTYAEAPPAPTVESTTSYRSDAVEGPLLIYTAQIVLAAFEVASTLDAAIAHVEAAGGHVQQRTRDRVVLRVPAPQFREILESLQDLGDVLNSQWHAEDVSETFRDTQIRLRNAMAARDRIEALLAQADSVEDVLAIERQLQRLTLEIEQSMGALRAMTDRILLSTITLEIRQRTSATPPTVSRLPFPWLRALGLPTLLRL